MKKRGREGKEEVNEMERGGGGNGRAGGRELAEMKELR